MVGRSRDEVRSFWRMAIEMQRESELSIVEFCRREGLHPASFYSWRRKFARSEEGRDGTEFPCDRASRMAVRLTPVQVVEDQVADHTSQREAVEVVAPDGLVLRVPSEAASDNVRRVLQLLRDVS